MSERKIGSGVYVPLGVNDPEHVAHCHRTAYRMARDVGGMPEFLGRVLHEDGRTAMYYRIVTGAPKGDLLATEQFIASHGRGKRPKRLVEWSPGPVFDTTKRDIDRALFGNEVTTAALG